MDEKKDYKTDELVYQKMRVLVELLNKYSDSYYNGESIVTDEEYDHLYNMLEEMEKQTGVIISGSPINKVGYEVKDNLDKVKHEFIPMLSLDKIHSIDEIIDFLGEEQGILSVKADGLTVRLTYKNGELVKAETRGDGITGSDVTHNAKVFRNIPLRIDSKEDLIVEGEAVCLKKDFDFINKNLEKPFKNQRAVASGSIGLLNSEETKDRRLSFLLFKVVKGFEQYLSYSDRFLKAEDLGFTVIPWKIYNRYTIDKSIDYLVSCADKKGIPYDGIVISYNDIAFGDSKGRTEHHFRSGVAYKFYDKSERTTLRNFEWSMGRTGDLTPVAIFDPVEIDGTEVSRASCHNLTYVKNMFLGIGDEIGVYKANMIIPQIRENYTNSRNVEVPKMCPYCGTLTEIRKDKETEVLYCPNDDCNGRILGKISHFVSKPAMNIEGLSVNTIEFLLENDLISTYKDLYHLKEHKDFLLNAEGFKDTKVNNILSAIEKSRKCKLSNFIISLGIPLVGKTASKEIDKLVHGDFQNFVNKLDNNFDFTEIDGFGKEMNNSLYEYWSKNKDMVMDLSKEMDFEISTDVSFEFNKDIADKTFCITGSLIKFKNRDELVANIEKHGGKVVSGVTKKTDFLITNDKESGSSKNVKAKALGIPIISEEEYIVKTGENIHD